MRTTFGLLDPFRQGPLRDAPVRARPSLARDAFRRIWTPRCHVVPFVTSCPRIGLALHRNDAARDLRTLSPSPRHRTRQRCGDFLPASAVRAARLAAPLHARREMRPTDFCLSSLFYEHLRHVGSRLVTGLAPHPRAGNPVFHDTAIRFGGSVDFLCARGVLFPRRIDATEPLTSLSRLRRRPAALSHAPARCRSSLDRLFHDPRDGIAA